MGGGAFFQAFQHSLGPGVLSCGHAFPLFLEAVSEGFQGGEEPGQGFIEQFLVEGALEDGASCGGGQGGEAAFAGAQDGEGALEGVPQHQASEILAGGGEEQVRRHHQAFPVLEGGEIAELPLRES